MDVDSVVCAEFFVLMRRLHVNIKNQYLLTVSALISVATSASSQKVRPFFFFSLKFCSWATLTSKGLFISFKNSFLILREKRKKENKFVRK